MLRRAASSHLHVSRLGFAAAALAFTCSCAPSHNARAPGRSGAASASFEIDDEHQASWPCSAIDAPNVRHAIDVIDPESFRADVARIEGVRDGDGPALERAAAYFEEVMTKSGFVVTRQTVSGVHQNLIAERRASRSTGAAVHDDDAPIVIATAHIDTVAGSPGADDNASGIATLLAIGRALSRSNAIVDHNAIAPESSRPRNATIRLIAFALEEEGFIGSMHYVRSLPYEARKRIRAVYNFDMVGFSRSGDGSQGWPADADVLADLRGRPLRRTGDFIGAVTLARGAERASVLAPLREARGYVPGLVVEDAEIPPVLLPFAPDLKRGDHVAFWNIGVPAVDVGDTAELRNPNYHAPSDTLDTLDLGFAAKVARWAAAGILIARRGCPSTTSDGRRSLSTNPP